MKFTNDEQKFLAEFRARAQQYVDRVVAGDLTKEFASFEMLMSIFSALEADFAEDKLTSHYPVKAWREDQVAVPRGLLRPLVDGWKEYIEGQPNLTLGKAMNLEGGGKGTSPVLKTEKTLDRNMALSNLVVVEIRLAELNHTPISQDAAIQAVVEAQNVNYETVRKAFRRFGPGTLEELRSRPPSQG